MAALVVLKTYICIIMYAVLAAKQGVGMLTCSFSVSIRTTDFEQRMSKELLYTTLYASVQRTHTLHCTHQSNVALWQTLPVLSCTHLVVVAYCT